MSDGYTLSGLVFDNYQARLDDDLKSVDFRIESVHGHGYQDGEDRIRPKYSKPKALPPHVKQAIKSKYEAGVTKPRKIMKSLEDDGIIEEGRFPISKISNHLQKMKLKMGVRKWQKVSIGGLEI